MAVILPSSDVSAISGVGKTRKEQLNKLNIFTVKDLLFHFPRQYENRGNVTPLSEATLDSPNSFVLTVATEVKTVALKKGVTANFRAIDVKNQKINRSYEHVYDGISKSPSRCFVIPTGTAAML